MVPARYALVVSAGLLVGSALPGWCQSSTGVGLRSDHPVVRGNLQRVERALGELKPSIPPASLALHQSMGARLETLRAVLHERGVETSGDPGTVPSPGPDRAANRLFLALGDLWWTSRLVADESGPEGLRVVEELQALQWPLRDCLGLPHNVTLDEALQNQ